MRRNKRNYVVSKSKDLRFLFTPTADCEANLNSLIALAKNSCPFSCDWEGMVWNIYGNFSADGKFLSRLSSETARLEQGKARKRLLDFGSFFNEHEATYVESRGYASDFVKAYVSLLQQRNAYSFQGVHKEYEAARSLLRETSDIDYRIELITRSHFDAAEKYQQRFSHNTAYSRCVSLNKVAAFLDDNKLTRVRLNWKTRVMPLKPESVEELLEPEKPSIKKDRFGSEAIVKAIGQLYQEIPRDNSRDRYLICLIALIVIFGFRSKECVTLPFDAVRQDADGVWYIHYFRAKLRVQGDINASVKEEATENGTILHLGLQKKIIPTVWVDLTKDIFEELNQSRREVREVAQWIEQNGDAPFIPNPLPERLTYKEIAKLLGYADTTGLPVCERLRLTPIGRNDRGEYLISGAALYAALKKEIFVGPIIRRDGQQGIRLSEVIGIVFPNELRRGNKSRVRYAVSPLPTNVLRDFLGGRVNIKSVFEAYEIADEDGTRFKGRMHDLRRFINDVLDRGGLSELAQAEWFGRKSGQNSNYQSKTPYERAEELRPLIDSGRFKGAISEGVRVIPLEYREAYLRARVRTIHETPVGLCARDVALIPCELHYDCDDSCCDLLLDSDADKREFFVRGIEVLKMQITMAKRRLKAGLQDASLALKHQERKLETYLNALKHLNSGGEDADK